MRRVTAVFAFLFLLAAPLLAEQKGPSKEKKVRELLELTGAGKLGVQMVDAMMGSFESSFPNVPDDFWVGFREEVQAEQIVDLVVPIYMKHISEPDLDELIRFYKSPAAQRFVEKQPLIMTESMEVGQKWGEELGQKAVAKMRAKGLLK